METSDTHDWSRDKRGRCFFTPEQRDQLLEEFAGSDLSANKFAAAKGIPSTTFSKWVRKARGHHRPKDRAKDLNSSFAFAEMTLPSPENSESSMILELPHEMRLRLQSAVCPQWLAALIRQLQPKS